MREIIHKVFWAWEFDREEKWLNEMAAKGLGLVSVGFCKYEFEDCDPGEYRICLQLLDKMPSHPESKKYIVFLESTGAEQVGSLFRWVYFRKKASDGEFALFSDNASRIRHLTGVITCIGLLTVANWIIGINNILLEIRYSNPLSYIGVANIAVGILGTYGCIRLLRKRNRVKEESRLFE